MTTVNLTLDGPITSSAGGVVSPVFSSNDVLNSPSWASFAALYNEFRVLAVGVQFIPNAENSVVPATDYAPIYEVDYRADQTALVSYSDASSFASMRSHSVNRKWMSTARMAAVEEASFLAVTSGGSTEPYGLKWYGEGFTVATTYGRYREIFLVQFRTRAN